jgi:hypothetical protein
LGEHLVCIQRVRGSSPLVSTPSAHPTVSTISAALCWRAHVSACGEAGDYSGGVPPVPIPNTVVKPSSPDDTAGAALWDNRTLPVSPPAEPSSAHRVALNVSHSLHPCLCVRGGW